jgi:hypothetical protein
MDVAARGRGRGMAAECAVRGVMRAHGVERGRRRGRGHGAAVNSGHSASRRCVRLSWTQNPGKTPMAGMAGAYAASWRGARVSSRKRRAFARACDLRGTGVSGRGRECGGRQRRIRARLVDGDSCQRCAGRAVSRWLSWSSCDMGSAPRGWRRHTCANKRVA